MLLLVMAGVASAARPKGQDGFSFGGYVHVQWMNDFRPDAVPAYGFELRRARVEFCYDLDRAGVEIELGGDKLDLTLKDAFVRYQVATPLQLVAGLRKMGFSHEELTPASKLLTIERGEMNDRFGEADYLGRDIGLAAEGELLRVAPGSQGLTIGYALGVFNGSGTRRSQDWNDAKQFCERLTLSKLDWLSFGANASQRNDSLTGQLMTAWGGDISLRPGRIMLEAEALYGDAEPGQRMLGGYVQCFWRLNAFEPGIRFEQMYPSLADRTDRTTTVTTACNWHLRRRLELKANLVSEARPDDGLAHKIVLQAQAGF